MSISVERVLELVKQYGTGGQPQTQSFGTEIYGEIYLPPLCGIQAIRRTRERFEQFDWDFEGKTVLDVGCHIGSLCFFAHGLGAKKVTGVDLNTARLMTASAIQEYNNIPEDKIQFLGEIPDEQFDIVICCSVDDYILDKTSFYTELIQKAKEVLIFESNVQVYGNHPFADFCLSAGLSYDWIGEAVDKYPFGKDRVRNLFRVIL